MKPVSFYVCVGILFVGSLLWVLFGYVFPFFNIPILLGLVLVATGLIMHIGLHLEIIEQQSSSITNGLDSILYVTNRILNKISRD